MKSNKAFILLGLLCAFVLLVSSVVADQTPQDETKVDEAKESKPYGQGGKSCRWQGGCCRWSKQGYGCLQCCHPSEIKADVEKLCERASLTWTGKCGNTQHCDKQCQTWEGAAHGACHKRGNWKCFCYFNC